MPSRALATSALCCACLLTACAARPRPADSEAPRVFGARTPDRAVSRPLTRPSAQAVTRAVELAPSETLAPASVRVLALRAPGPIVIPADPTWLTLPGPDAAPVPVLLDDGTRLHARLFAVRAWFEPSAQLPAPDAPSAAAADIASRMRAWLPPRAAFAAREVPAWPPPDAPDAASLPDAARAAIEVPVLLVEAPPETLTPRSIWVGLTRLDLTLITPAPTAESTALLPSTPPQAWQEGPAWLSELLTRERSHPLLSWRAALLAGELRSAPATPQPQPPQAPTLGALDLLQSWHAQTQGLWAQALTRLHAADASAAQRLRHRLTLLVRTDGMLIPAFAPTLEGERELLTALLDPRATQQDLQQAADLWLQEQPAGVAWIEDDAAYAGAAGQRVTRVRLANLSASEAVAYAVPRASDAAPDLLRVDPASAVLAPVATGEVEAPPPGTPEPDTALLVRVADWSATLAMVPPLALRPPGLIAEEFAPDVTLGEWLTGDAQRPASATLRARIYRAVRSEDTPRWEVLVTADAPAQGLLEFSLSDARTGGPASILVDPASSRASAFSATASPAGGPEAAVIAHAAPHESGWAVRVELPEWATTPSGELVLGIAWIDQSGQRACWPRAAAPWAPSCSRALLDAGAWDR